MKEENIKSIIVQGFVGMLFLLLMMTISDLVRAGLTENFSLLQRDPGIIGLWLTSIAVSVNVLIQIAIRTFDGKKFRWSVFGISIVYVLLFILHQIFHFVAGDGINIHFVFDITHHIIGIWVIIYAFKWARLEEQKNIAELSGR